MTVVTVGAALAVVALATVVQRLTGMGFGVVAVPLLALAAPDVGVLAVLLLTVVVMAAVSWTERDALDGPALALSSIASLPGVLLGTLLATALPPTATQVTIGLVVVAGSAASMIGRHPPRNRATLAAGAVAAGVLTPVAALPGPPMAVVYRPDDVRRMRATLSAFFAVGSLVSAVTVVVTGTMDWSEELGRAAVLLPGIVVGAGLAVPLVSRTSPRTVRSATLSISLLSGVALVVKAVAES